MAPNRINVITSIDGLNFAAAWPNRVQTSFGDQSVWLIGRDDLLINKRASGRPQDLLDVPRLIEHN